MQVFFRGGIVSLGEKKKKKMCIHLNPVSPLLKSKEPPGWENLSSWCSSPGNLAFINA